MFSASLPHPDSRDRPSPLNRLTMAVDFALGTPFASALQSIVQPKLAEYGWTTGDPEDSTIFEYILLMLGNNKDEAQIASELSNDLLDLGPDNAETQQFAHWLFEQIEAMRHHNGAAHAQAAEPQMDSPSDHVAAAAQDTEMEGAAESTAGTMYEFSFLQTPRAEPQEDQPLTSARRPTGPKAMRNGSGSKTPRGGRMLNQLNKQMDRADESSLHRIRGSQGSGRISSHSREPPKGPRSQSIGRGLAAMANGRGMANVGMNMGHGGANGMNGMGMNQVGGMQGMPMPPMGQNGMPGMLNPQQQMALMQMYEQQAHMMQQIFSGQTPAPFVNPSFQHNNRRNGRSSGERVDKSRQGNKQNLPPSSKFAKKDGQDETMTDSAPTAENGESSVMEVEGGRADPSNTICKFNLRCSKPDCPFVHQSPAAPEGTPIDLKDTCTYGAACTNKKCVGKHPSPAQRQQYQADKECAFFPNCRDMANCPYKHPSMPPCRNGADCTTPGCKFWHNSVMCKYNPCTNKFCPFKHVEGQKKTFKNMEWIAPKTEDEEKKDHVSERKFVDEEKEEELIIPGKDNEDVEITT